MVKKTSLEWLFHPIENEKDVSLILNSVSMYWYITAIIYFVIGIIYYFSTKPSLGFLSDTILCLSGGYFIPNRKSRALSIFLLSYAGLTTVLTFLLIVGLSKDDFGTKNLFLGMGLIAMSYRSLFATYVYHRLIKSEISVTNILIVLFIVSIISVVYCFSIAILCMIYDINYEFHISQQLLLPVYTMIMLTAFTILTKWLPFANINKTANY